MKSTKIIAGFLASITLLSQVSVANVKADSANASRHASFNLTVPKNASKVFKNDAKHVQYQVDNAVTAKSNDGKKLVASEVVDSQITTGTDGVIKGETTVTSDLSQAQIQSTNDPSTSLVSLGKNFLGSLLGTTAYASTNTNYNSTWDKTLGVKLYQTVYWEQSGTGARVYQVTGGYVKQDTSIAVTGSNVLVGSSSGPIQQIVKYTEAWNSSWTVRPSFNYVLSTAYSVGGATYTAGLGRGTSLWSVQLVNTAWSSGGSLFPR